MQDSFDVTTLIFLALAVFVIWRLRSVLGQKTGTERSPFRPIERNRSDQANVGNGDGAQKDNVVRLPNQDRTQNPTISTKQQDWKDITENGSLVATGLQRIMQLEPSFDASVFLEGAKKAYETIVVAFAKGDRKTLRTLLSREVAEGFEGAITERERKNEIAETTFVSVDKADLAGIEVKNKSAHITVRFLSNLINATRDKDGKVVDGNPEAVVEVTDTWTFARSLGSRDPNWQLVATDAGA